MDYELHIRTKGDLLSTNTLSGIIGEINRDFERSIYTALSTEFPRASTAYLKRLVRHKIGFTLKDVRRGSWEILIIGSIGGIIGKALYDLSIDFVKSSPQWQDFKNRIGHPSQKIAENLKEKLEHRQKIGPLVVERQCFTIEHLSNGVSKIVYSVELNRKIEKDLLIDTESQIDDLIQQIENTPNSKGGGRSPVKLNF